MVSCCYVAVRLSHPLARESGASPCGAAKGPDSTAARPARVTASLTRRKPPDMWIPHKPSCRTISCRRPTTPAPACPLATGSMPIARPPPPTRMDRPARRLSPLPRRRWPPTISSAPPASRQLPRPPAPRIGLTSPRRTCRQLGCRRGPPSSPASLPDLAARPAPPSNAGSPAGRPRACDPAPANAGSPWSLQRHVAEAWRPGEAGSFRCHQLGIGHRRHPGFHGRHSSAGGSRAPISASDMTKPTCSASTGRRFPRAAFYLHRGRTVLSPSMPRLAAPPADLTPTLAGDATWQPTQHHRLILATAGLSCPGRRGQCQEELPTAPRLDYSLPRCRHPTPWRQLIRQRRGASASTPNTPWTGRFLSPAGRHPARPALLPGRG